MATFQTYQAVTKRLMQSTWNNMSRNKLLSFATILVIILIVFFLNILGSINYLANYSIESINKKVDLTLELKEGTDINAPEVDQLKSELEQNGTQVVKISKEQALQDFKQILPDLGNFLETYRQNPLPASLYVTAKSIQDYEKISTIVEKPQYKNMINFDQNENGFQNQKARIYKILDLSQTAKRFVLILQILFFLVSIIIILNTIQIVVHNRRDEIKIMKLVGASKQFITAPFLLEGIFYGIIGVVIGLFSYVVIINLTYFNINQFLPGMYIKSFVSSLWQYYSSDMLWILLQQLTTFIIIGSLSSMIALSRFLKLFYSPAQLLTNNRKKV
jgi:cell division transport system permease protein